MAGLLLSDYLASIILNTLVTAKDLAKPETAQAVDEILATVKAFNPLSFIVHHPRWFVYLLFWNAVFDLASIASTLSFLVGLVRYRGHPVVFLLLSAIVAVACALGSLLCAAFIALQTTIFSGALDLIHPAALS